MNPPWLTEIKKHEGDSDSNHLPEIIAWIEEEDPTIKHEVAWCAATARHFIKWAGYDVTGITLAAVSFLGWGKDIGDTAIPGCVVVFKWKPGMPDAGGHHVTFMDDDQSDVDGDHIAAVGGNQSHMIKRSIYPLSCVMDGGFRMPSEYKSTG